MSAMIVWIAIGAAMMYFFDPVSGRERRTWLRDRFDRVTKKTTAPASTTDPQHLAPEQPVMENRTSDPFTDPHVDEPYGGRVSEFDNPQDREDPTTKVQP